MIVYFLGFIIVASVCQKLYSHYTKGVCKSHVCLVGKTAIVTGANSGLGYETALDFAKRGAKVILGCRDETRAKEAVAKIKEETHNNDVHYKLVNFASLKSVKEFAKEVIASENRLDILVNNAGVAGMKRTHTNDGIPSVFQINYLSHFLLTNLLLDLLMKNKSRVVNVSSILASMTGQVDFKQLLTNKGHFNQYNLSKLCQILFTIEFARRFTGTNVTIYSLHPGYIRTNIFKKLPTWSQNIHNLFAIFGKSPEEGAQTQIHCALANGLEKYNGEHFEECHLVQRYKTARDPAYPKLLWDESEKMVRDYL